MMNKNKVQACTRAGAAIAIARYCAYDVFECRYVNAWPDCSGKRHSTLVPLQSATSPLPLSNWLEKIWVERRRRKSWAEALVPVSIRTLGGRTNAELDSSASENGRRTVSRLEVKKAYPDFIPPHSGPPFCGSRRLSRRPYVGSTGAASNPSPLTCNLNVQLAHWTKCQNRV